ncbi:hypothetical protein D3C71_22950 [compost metagenome]
MYRLRLARQRGFGLFVFVLAASAIALSLVLGYSGMMTREEANRRPVKQRTAMEQHRQQILAFYRTVAGEYDRASAGNTYTVADVLKGASINQRWGLQAEMSNLLPAEGNLRYRRFVLYYPSETDEANPPSIEAFRQTGVFQSCANPDLDCAKREFMVFDTLSIHREAAQETQRRLERIALKAQAYFKARMMQDPEKNISVNYFRPMFGKCDKRLSMDLQCVDTFAPLVVRNGFGWAPTNNLAQTLGLTDEELLSAWGDPIEVSNKEGSEVSEPPFTMVFRVPSPFGGYYTVRAIQQI